MLSPLNAVQKATRDTLVQYAESTAHEALAAMFLIPYYRKWPLASWRKGLHAVAYGPRGIGQNVLGMLRGMFSHAETKQRGFLTSTDISTKAAASITVVEATAAQWNNETIIIKDHAGNTVEFKGNSSASTLVKTDDTHYLFGTSGLSTTPAIASKIKDGIALAITNADIYITAVIDSSDSSKINLTQTKGGDKGNTTITGTAEANGECTIADFSGGVAKNQIVKDTTYSGATWPDSIIGRWIEIKARTSKLSQYIDAYPEDVPEGIYQVIGTAAPVGSSSKTLLNLAPVGTAQWSAPKFNELSQASHLVDVNILPFKIREETPGPLSHETPFEFPTTGKVGSDGYMTPFGEGCKVEVLLYKDDVDQFVPPPATYMQADGSLSTAAGGKYYNSATSSYVSTATTPKGGNVQGDAFEQGDPNAGPHPPYLGAESKFALLSQTLRDITAAGVKLTFTVAVDGEV